MDKKLSESLCPLPWVNMSIDVDGSNRPCCRFSHQSASSGYQMGNLKTHTIEDLWQSEGLVKLRQDLRSGQKPSECKICWDEEAAGVKSYRQDYLNGRIEEKPIDYSTDHPTAPQTLDLKLSNLCNLRCRICGPVASSLWLKESLKQKLNSNLETNQEYYLSNKITDHGSNRETFIKWLPHLSHVEMFGGEPLLSRENREIEEIIITQGFASKISLLYNTNITTFRNDMVERWKLFKKVTLSLSLDDIDGRIEYERSPAKWDVIRRNVLKYSKIQCSKIKVVLFCSVSNQNVWYLPEYLEWVVLNAPNLEVSFNFVHSAPEFCITNLPRKIKIALRRKFESWTFDCSPHYQNDILRQRLLNVLDFAESRSDIPEVWKKFKESMAHFDEIRGQNFALTFPEFYKLISAREGSNVDRIEFEVGR
ncbi:MAG: twitch domain-containing radical SAM protein [Oligoflexia bacterium]|nr:twitch domain-containing radical SAM protein [Oligoflexia bacterium]